MASTSSSTAASLWHFVKYLQPVSVQTSHMLPRKSVYGGVRPGEAGQTAVLRLPHACNMHLYSHYYKSAARSAGTRAMLWHDQISRYSSMSLGIERDLQCALPKRQGAETAAGSQTHLCVKDAHSTRDVLDRFAYLRSGSWHTWCCQHRNSLGRKIALFHSCRRILCAPPRSMQGASPKPIP